MMFKKGDRVKVIVGHNEYNKVLTNKVGTVVKDDKDFVGVEFDEHIRGHDCDNGSAKNGYGWFVQKENLVPFQDKVKNWRNKIEND